MRKHYVWIGDDGIEVRTLKWFMRDMQVMADLERDVLVRRQDLVDGSTALSPVNDPECLYASDLPRPKLANELVWSGALGRERWAVKGGIWLFGPGRGWSRSAAVAAAQRLLENQ